MKFFLAYWIILMAGMIPGTLFAQEVNPEMIDFIKKEALSPGDYIVKTFERYDVVFLGEQHVIKENLLLVQQLIPQLYENGILTIGMEFGANEVQDKLDKLVTSKVYDENLAKEIMFTYNVAWGFQEYVDVYKAAWKFNQTLPEGAPTFRILNLSYIYNWEKFAGKRDRETTELVFDKGPVDKFRAELIEKEVILKNKKMLALVGTPHAYTRYASSSLNFNSDHFCDFDDNWLGNRLYKKYPEKVFSILLHQAFTQKEKDTYFLVSPAGGAIEALMALNDNQPAGFDLIHTPVGALPDRSMNAICYEDFTMEQFFDGYIFLEPLRELEGCTVIEDFVNEKNINHAIKNFPDPDWHEPIKSLEDMKHFIQSLSIDISIRFHNL